MSASRPQSNDLDSEVLSHPLGITVLLLALFFAIALKYSRPIPPAASLPPAASQTNHAVP